ncbi:MAG: BON domain-containing protein, partial [Candidatus Limnocylindria bacterium]
RVAATARRVAGGAERAKRSVTSEAYGLRRKIEHRGSAHGAVPNDATLARKVESELFRDASVPKGSLSVNAENGTVVLRGEVGRPEDIEEIERRVRSIGGVAAVHNLLHLPGTPAPRS